MDRRTRILVAIVTFLLAWFGCYVALSLPMVLLDGLFGLRLQYRRGLFNLFTLTLALAALPAAAVAWWRAARALP